MVVLTKLRSVCSILLVICFVVGCGRQKQTDKLIDEINISRVKARTLTTQAEAKRAEASRMFANGDGSEGQKLTEEAADLYGQIAEVLNKSADQGDQVVGLSTTDWFKNYFTLYAKWTRNLAKMAGGAREELLVKKTGGPSHDQLRLWRENISKLRKENEELRNEIAKIESEHNMVLIREK